MGESFIGLGVTHKNETPMKEGRCAAEAKRGHTHSSMSYCWKRSGDLVLGGKIQDLSLSVGEVKNLLMLNRQKKE